MKHFIETYISRGFGSMTKNDFEVYIFNWLITIDKDYKDLSDYDLSVKLRIPISKVKRLRYEASLKYQQNDKDSRKQQIVKEITDLLKVCKYRETEKGGISFVVNNKFLREYLQNFLNQDGRFFDSSFNSNIVSIATTDFIFLLDNLLLSHEDQEKIMKSAKDSIGEKKDFPKTFSELLKDAGKGFCKHFAEDKLGEKGTDAVISLTEMVMHSITKCFKK